VLFGDQIFPPAHSRFAFQTNSRTLESVMMTLRHIT
jgi:hypothetical protein